MKPGQRVTMPSFIYRHNSFIFKAFRPSSWYVGLLTRHKPPPCGSAQPCNALALHQKCVSSGERLDIVLVPLLVISQGIWRKATPKSIDPKIKP